MCSYIKGLNKVSVCGLQFWQLSSTYLFRNLLWLWNANIDYTCQAVTYTHCVYVRFYMHVCNNTIKKLHTHAEICWTHFSLSAHAPNSCFSSSWIESVNTHSVTLYTCVIGCLPICRTSGYILITVLTTVEEMTTWNRPWPTALTCKHLSR